MSFIIKTGPLTRKKNSVLVSVGKNSLKKAAERNLLKRRARAILRGISENRKVEFLVVVRPPIKEKTFGEIKSEILGQLARLK